jgi:crotonobetaine/carnitine-CoA ligase
MTTRSVDDLVTLPRLVTAMADICPDRLYARSIDGPQLTYAEVDDHARRWASALRDLGVGLGDGVASMLFPSPRFLTVWLGISFAGAIDIGVNTDFRGRILRYVLEQSSARVMVVDEAIYPVVAETLHEVPTLRAIMVVGSEHADGKSVDITRFAAGAVEVIAGDDLHRASSPSDAVGPYPWDVSCMIYTSGTTGPSKGVLVPWGEMQCMASITFDVDVLTPDDTYYCPWPAFHLSGRFPGYTMALAGGSVVYKRRFSLTTWLEEVRASGSTVTNILEMMAIELRAAEEGPPDRDHPLRHVFGPIIPDIDGFIHRFGLSSYRSGFGMTETGMVIMDQGAPGRGQAVGSRYDGFPGYELRIVDEHDRELPGGEVGELITRSSTPWTMNVGYFGMPEATANAWRNGWFHTGDALRLDEDGHYHFVDRLKDCIRRRAENISSFEVEAYVNEHPDVLESAAVAAPGAIAGDEEVRVVVVRRESSTLDAPDLIDFLSPRMPRFMLPRYVQFIEALPRTEATGRIRKVEIRDLPLDETVWDRERVGPLTRGDAPSSARGGH